MLDEQFFKIWQALIRMSLVSSLQEAIPFAFAQLQQFVEIVVCSEFKSFLLCFIFLNLIVEQLMKGVFSCHVFVVIDVIVQFYAGNIQNINEAIVMLIDMTMIHVKRQCSFYGHKTPPFYNNDFRRKGIINGNCLASCLIESV
mgnify:CR=1 FL=1